MNLNRPSNYEESKQLIKDLHKRLSKSLEKQKKVNFCLSQQIKTLEKHLQAIQQKNHRRQDVRQKNPSQLLKSFQITKSHNTCLLNNSNIPYKNVSVNNEQLQQQIIKEGKQDPPGSQKNNRRLKDQIMSRGFPASAKINKMNRLPYRFRI